MIEKAGLMGPAFFEFSTNHATYNKFVSHKHSMCILRNIMFEKNREWVYTVTIQRDEVKRALY